MLIKQISECKIPFMYGFFISMFLNKLKIKYLGRPNVAQ